jgi:hypothetical protein
MSTIFCRDKAKQFFLFVRLGLFRIKHDSTNVVLIYRDSLSITFAESSQQIEESFVLELANAQTNQACNRRLLYLCI